MRVYYSRDHEWIDVEGDSGTVGITDFAQNQLGDVVFVEVPDAGKARRQGDEAAVVESVKAASVFYSAVRGTGGEDSQAVVGDPSLVNTSPEGEGWFFNLTLSDNNQPNDLMS